MVGVWRKSGPGSGGAESPPWICRHSVGISKSARGRTFESWKITPWIFSRSQDSSKKLQKNVAGTRPDCRPKIPTALPMKSRNEVVASVRAKIRLLHFAFSTEVSYGLRNWPVSFSDPTSDRSSQSVLQEVAEVAEPNDSFLVLFELFCGQSFPGPWAQQVCAPTFDSATSAASCENSGGWSGRGHYTRRITS
jgi:hypothetical protein